jgi:hypothetical protein
MDPFQTYYENDEMETFDEISETANQMNNIIKDRVVKMSTSRRATRLDLFGELNLNQEESPSVDDDNFNGKYTFVSYIPFPQL